MSSRDIANDTQLRCMRNLAYPSMVISVACIVVGALSILNSAPQFIFPFCLGGAMIAGLAGLFSAIFLVKLYNSLTKNYGMFPDDSCWRCQAIFVGTFLLLALIIGLGISGIWGMVEANNSINMGELFPSAKNDERAIYGQRNLGYAISTFVLVMLLCILKMIAYCACQCYRDDLENGQGTFSSRNYFYSERTRPQYDYQTGTSLPANQVITSSDRQSIDVNYNSTDNDRTEPSAPRQNIEMGPSTHTDNSTVTRDNNDSTSIEVPPPAYEDVVEQAPPTYRDVLETGGFSVVYV
ncbi:hypothetical protein ACF0H5_021363 [Mactra antiquata]